MWFVQQSPFQVEQPHGECSLREYHSYWSGSCKLLSRSVSTPPGLIALNGIIDLLSPAVPPSIVPPLPSQGHLLVVKGWVMSDIFVFKRTVDFFFLFCHSGFDKTPKKKERRRSDTHRRHDIGQITKLKTGMQLVPPCCGSRTVVAQSVQSLSQPARL